MGGVCVKSDKNQGIKYGDIQEVWNTAYTRVLRYTQEIWHEGLKEHKLISAPELSVLTTKVNMQVEKWKEKWIVVETKNKENLKKQASQEEAARRSQEAEKNISDLEQVLLYSLNVNDAVDWETIKHKEKFPEKKPDKPEAQVTVIYPLMPDKNSIEFTPRIPLLGRIFKSIAKKVEEEYEAKYQKALNKWEKKKLEIDEKNKKLSESYKKDLEKWEKHVKEWEGRRDKFLENQRKYNEAIDNLRNRYNERDTNAILEYCELVLNRSELPSYIKKDYELEYNSDTRILIVDYKLPLLEDLPKLKEVKYIQSKNELKESFYSQSFVEKLYDTTIYRIILRLLHELFEADVINAIEAISLNGWVNYINKATGKNEDACIASIQVKKDEFDKIDLHNVEPKACFKNLKGIGSSKLSGITPIQPILRIDKNDRRFIQSYDVSNTLQDVTNLATLDWEDFEHLIRELFEKEFSVNGGEVKVTQASRDGGVDAVAFDPDPIRGGKIVIQAKRYTNIVGVSAVRDLYGTVMNEGATKGILVTTADYGPDAYEFARNKPLTLLNGGNLLHLLERHGHRAMIDLRQAKLINKENGR
ncbi:MAG: restriction endonuclease [Clostridia bacterium]|jgi:restriction system protein|nr:restriction endonuclease [Clostridia bacterium]